MNIIDLTHTFTDEMPVFPVDDLPLLKQSVDKDNAIVHYFVSTGMHVGTHMDGPLHMIPDGIKLSEISSDRFVAPGHIIDARGVKKIDSHLLINRKIKPGDCVLVYTGFEHLFRTPQFYTDHPDMTEDFARKLIDFEVKFVGMDTPSPDKEPYPIHRILLKKEILIIESMNNLSQLLNVKKFEIIALPAKFDTEAAPVRVIARIIG